MAQTTQRPSRFIPGEVRAVQGDQTQTVPCVRLADLPGAALHRMLDHAGWALTHERSGLAIRALLPTERVGRRLMRRLAGHNFDREQAEVIRDERLTADVLGHASQLTGEQLYAHNPDGTWTLTF